ncbi:MAG: hypothetical protein MJA83_10295 [Gammaproteobacteria bacterium]|nr:hypothetical protein [Gammaproteobacteria bacterium]
MEQESLFIEDVYEALRVAVMALGGTKVVGTMLWGDKPADKAGELLANCLNRTRPEKLDPEQFIFLQREAKKVGCHAIPAFTNQDTGYAPPIPIEPEDEKAQLQRDYIAAVKLSQQIAKRMEKFS